MRYKTWLYRIFFYILGMLLLALGITMTTKTGLGVSPIISVPFSIATIFEFNFADITFFTYIIFILLQVLIKKKKTRIFDLLQIALSVIFTRVLYLFSEVIEVTLDHQFMRFLVLFVAILLTGIGAAMTMNARLVANPGDGIVQTISDAVKKEPGFVKNFFDLTCILISVTIGMIFEGTLVGIGFGTVIAFLGVGRVIWAYNKLVKGKTDAITGIKLTCSSFKNKKNRSV